MWVRSLSWEDPLEEEMATHSSILPGESHGQRSLVGYSPWNHKEQDMIEHLIIALNTKGKLIFNYTWDFPGGPNGDLPICLPIQGTWVDSWSEKIPHAVGQLSPHTTATEPAP